MPVILIIIYWILPVFYELQYTTSYEVQYIIKIFRVCVNLLLFLKLLVSFSTWNIDLAGVSDKSLRPFSLCHG